MIKTIFTIQLCFLLITANAQWLPTGATTGNIYYNNGNVGIGTSTPAGKLSVNGNIQLTNSTFPMGIFGEVDPSFTLFNMSFNFRESNKNIALKGAAFRIDSRDAYPLFQWIKRNAGTTAEVELMTLSQDGNLGIGTVPNASYKLAVAGSIITEAVVVQMRSNWPDYVFDSSYQLMSLSDLEKYIIANRHLPEIPSAKEVHQKGIELGEMNKLLLKKVEELTLYILELEKKNSALDERLKVLESK